MKTKLSAIAAAVCALVWAAPAVAGGGGGGPGALQAGVQYANTAQGAVATAVSDQNAVNANVPVSIAGGNVSSGLSSASQTTASDANAKASNDAATTQNQTQTQNVSGSSCSLGCGGAGAAQIGAQVAKTDQAADAKAVGKQNAVNANVPVAVAGGNVSSGSSSADQNAGSDAKAKATNAAATTQNQTQTQNVGGGSSCKLGCGGAGGAQIGAQVADTKQGAESNGESKQNAVNANVPVSIAGGNVTSGSSSAKQTAGSKADAKALNAAGTTQNQTQTQDVGGGSSCKLGCGGAGGAQIGAQVAKIDQGANAKAVSDQNAVNANVPVAIAGGNVTSGSSSADQNADSRANAKASNDADTTQNQTQTQNVGGKPSCYAGCGGAGGAQIGAQLADTDQWADAKAISKQNAVNANAPVAIAGRDVSAGSSSATQDADSHADSRATNDAGVTQSQDQTQTLGGGSACNVGCGAPGGAQIGVQKAETEQWADADAFSDQNAVNTNAARSVAGDAVCGCRASSTAAQHADSSAKARASNDGETMQNQTQTQNVGSARGCGCRPDGKTDGHDCGCVKESHDGKDGRECGCVRGSGSAGGFQLGIQKAATSQWADAKAISKQNAVNANAPVAIAGHDISTGPSNAEQHADSHARSKARNNADTRQAQDQDQWVW